ncbi:NAD-binding protein [Kitasatospora sp. NPDC101183]|uniref:NAD-binding protein n=1 Tax=Kitasatospora sp. NPDC101183 TaxID=3364100 RepID=UPI00381B60E6
MTTAGWGTPPVEPISQHYIVCGGNALAHRLVLELVEHYEVPVVVLVTDRTRDHAPRIEQLPGVAAVVESAAITEEALRAVSVATARGIALVEGSDQDNIHAALSAQGHNQDLRIVLRMFNQRLGENIERLLKNGAALSGSATAAPAFAAAALGRPNSVEIDGRFLHVAFDEAITSDRICVVADHIDRQDLSKIRLMPEEQGDFEEFLRLAAEFGDDGPVIRPGGGVRRVPLPRTEGETGDEDAPAGAVRGRGGVAALQALPIEPREPISWVQRTQWRLFDTMRFLTSARLRVVLLIALAAVMMSFGLLWALNRDFGWTVYISLLDLAGAAQPDQLTDIANGSGTGGLWQRIAQVVITLCGITFAPVATAIAVEVLGSGRRGQPRNPGAGTRDHVIVVGLGNLGTRIAEQLHGLGVPVVGVERDPQARGIGALRALGLPVVVGDGPFEEQLSRARLRHSRAVVAVSGDDATNVEAALEARHGNPSVRVVVRLFDDDFARHFYATLEDAASRSVSYLAAPAFAAALMGREVRGTLSVFRHALLIAELTVEDGSGLIGMNRHDLEDPGGVRVIAVGFARNSRLNWKFADRTRRLTPGDRIVLAATRSGLARINTALVDET